MKGRAIGHDLLAEREELCLERQVLREGSRRSLVEPEGMERRIPLGSAGAQAAKPGQLGLRAVAFQGLQAEAAGEAGEEQVREPQGGEPGRVLAAREPFQDGAAVDLGAAF